MYTTSVVCPSPVTLLGHPRFSQIVISLGLSYASVPLYRAFCSATGFGGTPMTGKGKFEPERLVPVTDAKRIKVHFNADASDALPWTFTPQQKYIYVLPGETALAFYTAKNKSDKDIIGIATYNVTPDKVYPNCHSIQPKVNKSQIAPYFAKVECFCFEEQKLLAGEEVDLPLFFFIDRDYAEDRSMANLDDIVLSYTFFRSVFTLCFVQGTYFLSRARRNKYGHLEPDASEDVVDKSMGWSGYSKAEPRDKLA